MMENFFERIFRFQTDWLITSFLVVLLFVTWLLFEKIINDRLKKTAIWVGGLSGILLVIMTITFYFWVMPRGLTAKNYKNSRWLGEPLQRQSVFHPDRNPIIDLKGHHFQGFLGKPFSVTWQGYVNLSTESSLKIQSNVGFWLYFDDTLIEGSHIIDFGASKSDSSLTSGWFGDERWRGDSNLTFRWSSGKQSVFRLGVDEFADYVLSIRCRPFTYEGSPPQRVTVSIDDTAIDTILLSPGWRTYNLPISRTILQDMVPGFFQIRLTHSHVTRPSDVIKGVGDQRQLAVAYDFAVIQKTADQIRSKTKDEGIISFRRVYPPGIYPITLKISQEEEFPPFIKLLRYLPSSFTQEVIPKDYLFPQSTLPYRIEQRLPIEKIVLRGIIILKLLYCMVLVSLWCRVIIQTRLLLIWRHKKLVLAGGFFILLSLISFHFRYVCDPSQRFQTVLFFSYCFFLSVPCFYLVFRTIFPKFLFTFFFTLYLLLNLFPYKLFYPLTSDLCTIFSVPTRKLFFGLDSFWVLIGYGIFSLGISLAWLFLYHKKRLRRIFNREFLFYLAMALIVFMQIAPRLSENSPRMAAKEIHEHPERCGTRNSIKFFDACAMSDAYKHTYPSGIFRGVIDTSNYARVSDPAYAPDPLYINRRGLNLYLYSLLAPFMHPYYAAIAINGFYLYCIVMAGYALGRYLNLPYSITLLFPVLLSANFLLHYLTIDASFYVQNLAFSFFILITGYKLGIFSKAVSFKDKALFCTLLASSSLVYDPHVNVIFILLWGILSAVDSLKQKNQHARVIIFWTICYAAVPLFSQYGFETLLRIYHFEGDLLNVMIREDVFDKLSFVPNFIIFNLRTSIKRVNYDLGKVLFLNPMISDYLGLLGAFGVLAFWRILPGYVNADDRKGMYALYGAATFIPIAGSFIARIPPESIFAYAYTRFFRGSNHYMLLVLAQCIGIHYIVQLCCRWFLPRWFKPEYLVYPIVILIVMFSYYIIPAESDIFPP